jgi:predicted transcriptional regulator YdeE
MIKRFEIETLPEMYVAGLAVRTKNELEMNPATAMIGPTWERLRQIANPNPPAAIYTDFESDNAGYYTLVAGFLRKSAADFKAGEVMTKLPAGKYAKFLAVGPMPDAAINAWTQVWEAENSGSLKRAYASEIETYPDIAESMKNPSQMKVAVYISIK